MISILFIIAMLSDGPHVIYKPYKDHATCEAAKVEATRLIIENYPTAKASLTCFETPEPGNLT
jgi:hypothetical protein